MDRLLDPAALDVLRSVSPLAFGLVFIAGLAMGLAPSSYALYPVVAGYVAGDEERSTARGFVLSSAFVLGTATVDAVLGALFGLVGAVVLEAVARHLALWNLIVAVVLGLFGLALLRVVRVRWPVVRMTWRKVHTVPGAYALGIPFGLTVCPACTPIVLPMLGAAAATGTWWFGAAIMFTFGIARGTPLLAVGASTGLFARLERFRSWAPRLERAAGWLLALGALYFLVRAVRTGAIAYF